MKPLVQQPWLKALIRILSGISMVLLGLVFIYSYVNEAWLQAADHSRIFTYLPSLLLGVVTIAIGSLIIWLVYRDRQ